MSKAAVSVRCGAATANVVTTLPVAVARAVVAVAAIDYHGQPTRRPARNSWAMAVPCGW